MIKIYNMTQLKERVDYHFSIAKMGFDQEKYDILFEERVERDAKFNRENMFFPLYRN